MPDTCCLMRRWPIVLDVDDDNAPRKSWVFVSDDPPGVVALVVASEQYMRSHECSHDLIQVYRKFLEDVKLSDPAWMDRPLKVH